MYLFKSLFSVILGVYLGGVFRVLHLTLGETIQLLSTVAALVYVPTGNEAFDVGPL